MRISVQYTFLCVIFVIIAGTAARTVFLDVNSPEETLACGLTKDKACKTLKSALAAASDDGDNILVSPGVYSGRGNRDLVLSPDEVSSITIQAESDGVIFDISESTRLLTLTPTKSVTVIGITFQNAYNIQSDQEGGVFYVTNATLIVDNCIVKNNYIKSRGAFLAVYGKLSTITIRDSQFVNNSANHGGVIWGSNAKLIDITRSNFRNNTVPQTGGAISSDDCALRMNNVTAEYNRARVGGAFSISSQALRANISGCTIRNNSASSDGGAMWVYNTAVRAVNTQFESNVAIGDGGALAFVGGGLFINQSSISYNRGSKGGAVSSEAGCRIAANAVMIINNMGSRGGAFEIDTHSVSSFEDSQMIDNMAMQGGALAMENYAELNLKNTQISNNYGVSEGGAMWCSNSKVNMLGVSLTNNTSPTDENGGNKGSTKSFYCVNQPQYTRCVVTSDDNQYNDLCPEDFPSDNGGDNHTKSKILTIIAVVFTAVAFVACVGVSIAFYRTTRKNNRMDSKKGMWQTLEDMEDFDDQDHMLMDDDDEAKQ